MIRFSYIAFLFLSSASAFVTQQSNPKRTRTSFLSGQKPISWADYKHDHVDPITPHETPSKIHDHGDPAKRAIADEYWLKQFEDDKERLHRMMEKAAIQSSTPPRPQEPYSETWTHYKHDFIDPITPHESPSKVESHMDPRKRKIADEYWLQWYKDEKEKLHRSQNE